jgi:hypothetical protein
MNGNRGISHGDNESAARGIGGRERGVSRPKRAAARVSASRGAAAPAALRDVDGRVRWQILRVRAGLCRQCGAQPIGAGQKIRCEGCAAKMRERFNARYARGDTAGQRRKAAAAAKASRAKAK